MFISASAIIGMVPSVTNSTPSKMIRALNIMALLNALAFGASGSFGVITFDPSQMVSAVYVVYVLPSWLVPVHNIVFLLNYLIVCRMLHFFSILGALLFVEELGLRIFRGFVVRNVGFMLSWLGRAMFLLFVCTTPQHKHCVFYIQYIIQRSMWIIFLIMFRLVSCVFLSAPLA